MVKPVKLAVVRTSEVGVPQVPPNMSADIWKKVPLKSRFGQ